MSMRPETKAEALRAAARRGALRLPTAGTSMGNVITTGDRVTVDPDGTPRWGEVWAFCGPDDSVVVHRCIGRAPGGWRFRGDRRATADPVIPTDHLVGRVRTVHREDGRVRRLGAADRLVGGARALAIGLRYR